MVQKTNDFVPIKKNCSFDIIFLMAIGSFLLKTIPYVLSVLGGIGTIWLSQHYLHSPEWIDLMTNVSASLLSIPLVFLFYEYSNYLIQRRVDKKASTRIIADVNVHVRKIINQLRKITHNRQLSEIVSNPQKIKLIFTDRYIEELDKCTHKLELIVYKPRKDTVLKPQQIQILTFLIQTLNEMANEYKFHNNKKEMMKYFETVLEIINDWFRAIDHKPLF